MRVNAYKTVLLLPIGLDQLKAASPIPMLLDPPLWSIVIPLTLVLSGST
jgi:hypothetical protein